MPATELKLAVIVASVRTGRFSFRGYWEQFDAEGHPVNPTAANGAAKIMLDQLAWWGAVLHEARQTTPYQLAG